jgi:hypothetical protein
MTTVEHDQDAPRLDGPVTMRGVIASEWLKFRSLRSSPLVLAAAMAAMIVFGAIIAHNTRNPVGQDPEDVVASGPLQGYYLGQLLLGALGVLVVSGEYSSGMIRATLAAVPTRVPVLIGKSLVFTVVVGVSITLSSVAAFLVAQAELSGYRPTFSLADGSTLRVVLGTGVYLTLGRPPGKCPRVGRPQHSRRPRGDLRRHPRPPDPLRARVSQLGRLHRCLPSDRSRTELLDHARTTPRPATLDRPRTHDRLGPPRPDHSKHHAAAQRRLTSSNNCRELTRR